MTNMWKKTDDYIIGVIDKDKFDLQKNSYIAYDTFLFQKTFVTF